MSNRLLRMAILAGAASLSLLGAAQPANAVVTVSFGSPTFIPETTIDFHTLANWPTTNPVSFSQGGVDVDYFSPFPESIRNDKCGSGNSCWAPVAVFGLTDISTADPRKFSDVSFDVLQWQQPSISADLVFQVLDGSTVLNTAALTGVSYNSLKTVTVSGNGDTFDHVKIYTIPTNLDHGFAAGSLDIGAYDNIETHFGAPVSGNTVPEPNIWALMIVGFGGLGTMLRRSRQALMKATV